MKNKKNIKIIIGLIIFMIGIIFMIMSVCQSFDRSGLWLEIAIMLFEGDSAYVILTCRKMLFLVSSIQV